MEVLGFIKWQWGQIDRDTKMVGLVILSVMVSWVICGSLGVSFIGFILCSLATALGMTLIMLLCINTLQQWNKYKKIKEREAEDIVRKLRGSNNPRTSSGFF